jgi:hypothetical protein
VSRAVVEPTAAPAPPEFMRADVALCPCGEVGEIVLVCRECGRKVCAGCVLDDELGAQMCWMCIDWTPRGRSFKHGVARRRRRER